MSTFWYWTFFRCPDCGAAWKEYDARGSNYDGGAQRTVSERCQECEAERCRRIDAEHPEDDNSPLQVLPDAIDRFTDEILATLREQEQEQEKEAS